MRTDAPWPEIGRALRRTLAPRPPKPQWLVEEEVAPGRMLFGAGRRQWLALLGTVFGLGGAGCVVGNGAYRGAYAAAVTGPPPDPGGICSDNTLPFIVSLPCLSVAPDAPSPVGGARDFAILPSGRRRDPTQ